MKRFCLILPMLALLAVFGCDDDEGAGGTLLAQGTKTVPAGGDVIVADVDITVPGTLQATLSWSGGPTEVAAMFLQVAPSTVLGIAQSPSPVVSTVAVTAARVADGPEWRLIAINSSGSDVTVSYTVMFVPE